MSDNMLKVIEVLAESDTSWEDAANQAIAKASRSVHGIKSIYIKEFEAKVEDNRIVRYRINAKITFALD
ncbi:dodecin family protein [Guyparkeria hydrothermalis]|uniref:dodecin family protein n=1 Tax=Guyparkeria hydrothermalis TaxID=923 RepID=UPI0020203D52|nr:dodecin family protein [Guyparkeria hydrothermalis]MCL7744111.1 dodecin family protein [Guyparkeria hydrothermalis]